MQTPSYLNWTYLKVELSTATGLGDDVIHIHAGLALLLLVAWVLRRPPWDWRPWLVVLVAELINETYDMLQTAFPTGEARLGACIHDFWLTMLWPTVILLLFPRLVRRYPAPVEVEEVEADQAPV